MLLQPSPDRSWPAHRRGSLEVRTTPPPCHIAVCMLTLQLESVSFQAPLALAQKPASSGLKSNWDITTDSDPLTAPVPCLPHSHHRRTRRSGKERWAVTCFCHSLAARSLVPCLYMGSRVIIPALLTLLVFTRENGCERFENPMIHYELLLSLPRLCQHPILLAIQEQKSVE